MTSGWSLTRWRRVGNRRRRRCQWSLALGQRRRACLGRGERASPRRQRRCGGPPGGGGSRTLSVTWHGRWGGRGGRRRRWRASAAGRAAASAADAERRAVATRWGGQGWNRRGIRTPPLRGRRPCAAAGGEGGAPAAGVAVGRRRCALGGPRRGGLGHAGRPPGGGPTAGGGGKRVTTIGSRYHTGGGVDVAGAWPSGRPRFVGRGLGAAVPASTRSECLACHCR
ncbi:hypothetical protein BU14_0031s0093 [Porphyra umbilicalis]|uniref:Uncharacterized protein n=1 Tax=Porphyra umbilicalis TaxID=2786 RepID=A0A1X6PJD4_PORUM|nr:hypothetical protein BU14_0031s0093 [Porphyra umbilicalis]|eukprot:OSX80925.1 hypothetical protein BU14_0031s0093 [Porphyra umbilicalis]